MSEERNPAIGDGLELIRDRVGTCHFASILIDKIAAGYDERASMVAMFCVMSDMIRGQGETIEKLSAINGRPWGRL